MADRRDLQATEATSSDAPTPSGAVTSVDALRTGAILLGRYRVERVLGEGGMGVVVAARHLELDELFAFKFMLPAAAADPEVVERFIREARSAAKLRSEHVAKVHDVARLPSGEPYMLMEHLSGSDLESLVERNGALPLEDVVRYVREAADAVAEAHALGIVHRDLKPSNLFLHRGRGGRTLVKVLDFGISKSADTPSTKLTSTRSMLGSPLYMSPEQALHPKRVDGRSDVWSLGVVLYELATGTVPFPGESVPEVVAGILHVEPRPPSAHRPELPAWFDALVLRCLDKSVDTRLASVDALVEALDQGLTLPAPAPRATTRSVAITPPTAVSLTPTPVPSLTASRRGPLLAIGVLVGAALAAVAAVAVLTPTAPRREPPRSSAPGAAAPRVADSSAATPTVTPSEPRPMASPEQPTAPLSPLPTPSASAPRSSAPRGATRPHPTSTSSAPPTTPTEPHDPLDHL